VSSFQIISTRRKLARQNKDIQDDNDTEGARQYEKISSKISKHVSDPAWFARFLERCVGLLRDVHVWRAHTF
jgi:hypothetical protein